MLLRLTDQCFKLHVALHLLLSAVVQVFSHAPTGSQHHICVDIAVALALQKDLAKKNSCCQQARRGQCLRSMPVTRSAHCLFPNADGAVTRSRVAGGREAAGAEHDGPRDAAHRGRQLLLPAVRAREAVSLRLLPF